MQIVSETNSTEFWEFPAAEIHRDLPEPALVEHALARNEAALGIGGTVLVSTGECTGRSPNDKFIVATPGIADRIWTGANKLMAGENFARLWHDFRDHLSGRQVFSQDLYAGADPAYRIDIRVVTEQAWHSLFIRHMLRVDPDMGTRGGCDYLIVDCPGFKADPARHGCESRRVVAIDFERRMVLIGGTEYAGEIKKSVFTILNMLYPDRGVVPMHCSANHAIGDPSDSAIFFGLSGTGKTTLSSAPGRELIGDDEHGWSDSGLFNIEGGCYPKTLDLDAASEPEIHATTSKFATVIENMVWDPRTRALDFQDSSMTQNMRCAYPLDYIPNASRSAVAGHPKNIFMLTCDAFGVLPPIARLTPAQAMYHFLSGFTAKVSGTEQGVKEPAPVFSPCFGSPFLPLRPTVYGKLLKDRIDATRADCWLVNTGWTGGPVGRGSRMPIMVTRALLDAALNGSIANEGFREDATFGFDVPVAVKKVPTVLLTPRRVWSDQSAFDETAQRVLHMFAGNFHRFRDEVDDEVGAAALGAVSRRGPP